MTAPAMLVVLLLRLGGALTGGEALLDVVVLFILGMACLLLTVFWKPKQ